MTIRNPIEWGSDTVRMTVNAVSATSRALHRDEADYEIAAPEIHKIEIADLKDALVKGWQDFTAYRSDVVFISFIYPLAGLLLGQVALGSAMLPLIFPMASGFALLGPFAAAGLYELSRKREEGKPITWIDAFGVFRSPSFGAILRLGVVLMVIFAFWLLTALAIYRGTLGPAAPASVAEFVSDVFMTRSGWAMIILGCGAGFVFALLVLSISVVSFPLLLDRKVHVRTAMAASVNAVLENPVPMLLWGLIVAAALVLGSLPLLIGLIVVMPVLGHATWHLYRKIIH